MIKNLGGGAAPASFGHGGPALCAIFGHSFAARAHSSFPGGGAGTIGRLIAKQSFGPAAWIEAFSGGRLLCPLEMNFGVNGETTAGMLTHIDQDVAKAVAAGVKVVFLFLLNNDTVATPAQVAATVDNIRQIVRKWTEPGITAVLTGDFPAGTAANTVNRRTGNQRNGFNQIRRWCLEEVPRLFPGAVLAFDIFDKLAVWNSTNGDVLPQYFDPDALHPWSPFYSDVYAPVAVPLLLPLFPSVLAVPEASASEPYDATMNPRGNLATNGMLDGDNAGVATSWNNNPAAGITCTPTKVALAGGNGTWQQLSFSGTAAAAGAVHDFRQNLPVANIAPGDTVQAECLMEVDPGAVNLRGATLRMVGFDNFGGVANTHESLSFGLGQAGDKWPTRGFVGANALFHRTLPFPFPAGALTVGGSGFFAVRAVFDAAGTVSAVIRVRNLRLHKVLS